jgi:phytoene dehydrogenase-like protein
VGILNEKDLLEIPLSRNFDPRDESYDAIIIGAGMSGIAASIRLAMYDKKVLLLEKHTISGGLNSYYSRRKRRLDVGLHALTNFAAKGEKRKPLTKLLKQLRIPYDALELYPQEESQISFPEVKLNFNNDIELLKSEINNHFPDQKEGFERLLKFILEFNEVALDNESFLAKDVVRKYITDPLLLEMIFCPLLIYGSAWENDMDFSQFVIMFKSIYLEGFGRSRGGVRKVIDLLLKRAEEVGVEMCFRNGVQKILTKGNVAIGLETTRGQTLKADMIISCAGYPETLGLCEKEVQPPQLPRTGKMSFTETIFTLDKKPKELNLDKTIIFHNNHSQYCYQKPKTLFDPRSAVLCLPNNFSYDDYQEGVYRLTLMANYDLWKGLSKEEYKQKKEEVLKESLSIMQSYMPFNEDDITFTDVFTPTTVERYTGHFGGCVYGTPDKSRDGTTPIKGLYLCGTDQGFLGIIGSMLSGISMANLHGFMSPMISTTSEKSL